MFPSVKFSGREHAIEDRSSAADTGFSDVTFGRIKKLAFDHLLMQNVSFLKDLSPILFPKRCRFTVSRVVSFAGRGLEVLMALPLGQVVLTFHCS